MCQELMSSKKSQPVCEDNHPYSEDPCLSGPVGRTVTLPAVKGRSLLSVPRSAAPWHRPRKGAPCRLRVSKWESPGPLHLHVQPASPWDVSVKDKPWDVP